MGEGPHDRDPLGARARLAAQDQVGARLRGEYGAVAEAAVRVQGARVDESVTVTPLKPSRLRSSPRITFAERPAGRERSSAGYTAHEVITSLVPASIAL